MALKKHYSGIRPGIFPDWQGDFEGVNQGFFLFFNRAPTKEGYVSGVYIDGRGEGSFRGRINPDVFCFSMAYRLPSPGEDKSLPGEPIRFYSESTNPKQYRGEFIGEPILKGIKAFILKPYERPN